MDVIQLAYAGVLVLLGLLGLHRLYLVALHLRSPARPVPTPVGPIVWPRVTVQLPVYNELYVVERLLDAMARLDYPSDRLQIQVLDDSTDECAAVVGNKVSALREAGVAIVHQRRGVRAGFKAGALAAALSDATGDLICVFDADFVPAPDFLRRTVPCFEEPDVGMVQARWGHLNREQSLLTRIQAAFLDAHFAVEHGARYRAGRFFNFNGTAGVWRRAAIESAGGWQHDTLTEDLDLSYRAQLAGWRFVYLEDVVAPAELPGEVAAFKSQQRRWTRGAVQTAIKLLPRIWRSGRPWRTQLEATIHLTSNLAYALMLTLAILVFPAMLGRGGHAWVLWLELPVLLLGTGSVCLFFVYGQYAVGRSWRAGLLQLPALMAIGAGLALNNSLAALHGLFPATGSFVRTPKAGGSGGGDPRYDVATDATVWAEAVLALYFAWATMRVIELGIWVAVPVLALFLCGYGYLACAAMAQRVAAAPRRSVE